MSLETKPLQRALADLARPLGRAPARLPLPDVFGVQQLREIDLEAPDRRAKIWDLHQTFHCSIVGTCMTTGELKALLSKLKLVPRGETSDHELHKAAVVLAGTRSAGAKILNKTLDRKFRRQIVDFGAATTVEAVRRVWDQALEVGDIPGGYWAVMTHPATTEALVRHVFGEIHMLSHLVGAANRADIRRLRHLEIENTELVAKVERQQVALRDAVIERDRRIRELQAHLSAAISDPGITGSTAAAPHADDAMTVVLADVRHQLTRSERRGTHLERRIAELEQRAAAAAARATEAEHEVDLLRDDARALEAQLAALIAPSDADGSDRTARPPIDLGGATLLYVGGRAGQLPHLRALVGRANGMLLHHSGGSDESTASLPACISRAAAVLFPVDCVSHAAMFDLKRLCKQADKPYVPLRSASLATLLRGLDGLQALLQDRTLAARP